MFLFVLVGILGGGCTPAWLCLAPKKAPAATAAKSKPVAQPSPSPSPSPEGGETRAAKRAKKSEGMDAGKVSKMLTSLKYQADKGTGKKKEAAQQALEAYKNKSPDEKAEFLSTFESNGGVKGGLSWVAGFSKKQEQTFNRAFSEHVNYFTRPSILALNGMSIKDFDTQREALEVADQIIAGNMADYEEAHKLNPPKESNVNPLLNKYFYVHDEGLKTNFTDSETKRLELSKEISKKSDVATICDKLNESAPSVRPRTNRTKTSKRS